MANSEELIGSNICRYRRGVPIPVTVRSKAWVYGLSFAGIVGSNPANGMDVCVL
jgi:hypothetical protein